MRHYVLRNKGYRRVAEILDSIGDAAHLFFKRRSTERSEPKNILVVRIDHLGDALLSTGIPKVLKENFPSSRVACLTSRAAARLFDNNPFVDEVLPFDATWFLRGGGERSRKPDSMVSLVKRLRAGNFDTALGLRGDARENLALFLSGIRHRIGYGITGGGFLLTQEVSYRQGHEMLHSLDLLKALGVSAEKLTPQIYFSSEEERGWPALSERLGLSSKENNIGVQVDAGSGAKEWGVARLEIFVRLCAKRFPGHKIVLIGSDKKKTDPLDKTPEQNVVSTVGRLTIRELLVVLRHCRIFVGLDSGPAHMAAWLGVPTLFLYSGTNNFERWKCLSENAFFLRQNVPCSPCGLERCVVEGHPCMENIDPQEALRVVEHQLELTRP